MPQYSMGWSNLPPGAIQPVAPTSPTGWVVYSVSLTDCIYNTLEFYNSLNPAQYPLKKILAGPFAMQQEAAQWAIANCGGSQPSPSPAPVPPAPPGPPAPPPAPSGLSYWNVCNSVSGGFNQSTVQASSQVDALSKVPGAVAAFGPYATLADATLHFNDDYKSCSEGKGVPPSCIIKPLFDCPTFPPLLSAIGTPGTKEWCKALDAIVTALGNVGEIMFQFIDKRLDANLVVKNISDAIDEKWPWDWVKGLLQLMRQIVCWIGPFVETIRTSITCIRKWVASLYPKCNTTGLFGLLVIRHFLLTLERFEWGTDAAVWVVAATGLTIDPLMTTLDYLIRYACPVELIDEAMVIEAYKYNNIDEDTVKCILRAHGKQWETVAPGIVARGDKPGWREAMEYIRRQGATPADEDATLRNLGVLDPSYRKLLQTVYDELPTISDHLHFLQRNVHDDAYVKDFDLLNGFEDRFWKKFGNQLRALGMTKEIASLHYAAHWINPSFSQLFGMVQRLRVGRVDSSLVFKRDDLLRIMAEMDVAPYFRERLEAISHPIPPLSIVLQMYQFGQIDDTQIVEMLKDLGYEDSYANALARTQLVRTRRLNASSGHGWTPTALAGAYAVGKITADQVYAEMNYLAYTRDDADRLMRRAEIDIGQQLTRRFQQRSIQHAVEVQENAYKCGAIDAAALNEVLRNAGIPNSIAQIAIGAIDSEIAVGICNQQVQAFRRALLTGKATLDQIRGLMETVGIPLLRIDQYLKSWVIQAQLKAPQASAAQILRWVATGLLDSEVARQRLLNLGWGDPDLTLLLADSAAKLARAAARVQQLNAKSEQSAATQALKLARAAEAQARSLRQQLRGIAPMSTLRRWFKEGLLTEQEFLDYAIARGYPPADADKYLAEAIQARIKASTPKQPKPKPGVTSGATTTGPAGSPAPPPA